ncbi:polyphosphate glucokinase [Mucilaginibacter sp. HD30]
MPLQRQKNVLVKLNIATDDLLTLSLSHINKIHVTFAFHTVMKTTSSQLKILAIDIGGSHVKATVLDKNGDMLSDYIKSDTPLPANPDNIINAIKELTKDLSFDKISVGFPGYVRNNIVGTAPNLDDKAWRGYNLGERLEKELGKPAQVVNDADMQGLGVASGKGLELVVTLGTGFGTALVLDGLLLPHLEIAHHPITKTKDYDAYMGDKELEKIGKKKWNLRMERVFRTLKTVFNYDHLYIGGGNSRLLTIKLDDNMTIVSNKDGIKGGARLWTADTKPKPSKK